MKELLNRFVLWLLSPLWWKLKECESHLLAIWAKSPPIPSTFIMVLSPDGFMLSQRVKVSPGSSSWVRFQPHGKLPAGAWVTSSGPGIITAVWVGNNGQCGSYPYEGLACITRDAVEIGTHLAVEVKGSES